MKRTFITLLCCLLLSLLSRAQLRVAIVGGGHQSTVIEQNDLPQWDSIKNNYSGRVGVHVGFIADMPLSPHSHFYFQPGVIYYNKGRKYAQTFDTTSSSIFTTNSTQYINYIDIPTNLVLKFGSKTKFMIGGGPYLSFFYNGKESRETLYTGGSFTSEKNDDVPVGKKPGNYSVINYGVNALAGIEMGRVFLTANYSRGLNDFYKAISYNGTFKHQVIGATLGIYLGKQETEVKKIVDSDKDGIPDNKDGCPFAAGSAITGGCPDKDGDGIADKDDKCPNLPGTLKNHGCPLADTDHDGIPDNEDKCPTVAGVSRYQGCPIPDTDKDGINDDNDKCPTVFGVARYNGCPVPDTDGDGVNDEEDKCPTIKGSAANHGCPEIKKEVIEKVNFAARRILFQFAKADLQPASFKVLDDVAQILKENPSVKLSIEGHTSSDGIFEANMKLSQQRAENVAAYLESKGIAAGRLKAKGFGSTQPVNTGTTESEKSQNRRVELKLSN